MISIFFSRVCDQRFTAVSILIVMNNVVLQRFIMKGHKTPFYDPWWQLFWMDNSYKYQYQMCKKSGLKVCANKTWNTVVLGLIIFSVFEALRWRFYLRLF